MKYVKMLGLAAVAAAALMAFVGSSSASATVLCKTEGIGSPTGTTCPIGWAYEAGTTVHAVSVGTTTLTTSFKNIECGKSTVHGHTENEGGPGEPVKIEVTALTFEECNCTVTVINKGTLTVHWIEATHDGAIRSDGAEVTASCSTVFGTIHCIYATGAGTTLGTLVHGSPAKITISENNIPRLTTSALCAEKANWDATYEVTEPKPIWVSSNT